MNDYFDRFRQSCPPPHGEDDIQGFDINDRIAQIYAAQAKIYREDRDAFREHWNAHPSFCIATKCADGRVFLPSITKTPAGLVKPLRAIGGRFEAFWPGFREQLNDFVDAATSKQSGTILFATYHYSASSTQLGCKGWRFDTAGARAHTVRLCQDLSEVYRKEITAIPTGIETDRDMMVLNGPHGKTVTGEQLIGFSADRVRLEIRNVFPTMDARVLEDLLPFLMGNAKRVEELTLHPRSRDERGHAERIIAVGRGFSGLARANLALIQNDIDPNLDDAIVTQAEVVEANLRQAKPGDDATLFACMTFTGLRGARPYREARTSAIGLLRFAQGHIRHRLPELAQSGRLHHLVGVVQEETKELEILEDSIRR